MLQPACVLVKSPLLVTARWPAPTLFLALPPDFRATMEDEGMKIQDLLKWKRERAQEIEVDKELTVQAQVKLRKSLESIEHATPDTAETMNQRFAVLRRQAIVEADLEADSRMPDAPRPVDTKLAADAVVRQFGGDGARIGGLFVRGVESAAALRMYLESIPEPGQTLEALKSRRYNLEKYSYIRSDTTMRIFGGRSYGLLVDPNQVARHVRFDDGRAAIWSEDGVTTGTSKPTVAADLGRVDDIGDLLNAMIGDINEKKRADATKISNWNEVEILSAPPEAYVGLFYAWPTKKEAYDRVFTAEAKSSLAKLWHARTGQDVMRIYLYIHRGKPSGEDARVAQDALGAPGASTLALHEEVPVT
ncbi:hypothetical protein [Actinophytocola gossypii]|uniref:Uncharacterized protein n=1 Tax=Actinophytocola gossypii TaxID=2812003 RepID=A0ABT2J9N2_9PSEU|nr:hypothetical protein [Actinophytocola gossypii]MCT2584564.1 hypothetical protein [Actinophytocola gossypii]